MNLRPRRTLLFMPGSNARALEKAKTLAADGFIFDLEDAVAPDAKAFARQQIAAAVGSRGYGRREILVRINGLDTSLWMDDLATVVAAGPDGVVVPKVESAGQLKQVAGRLGGLPIWAMIETPTGILHAAVIAAEARGAGVPLAGFIIGPNDIARETRMRMVKGRGPMLPALSLCVFAARASGIDILDGVYNDFSDNEGFVQECAQARDLGFDGKTLIHPSQIEACNAAFTPPAEEIARARDIIAAFERPENAGKGAIQIGGQMVERLHMEMARRTVAIAEVMSDR